MQCHLAPWAFVSCHQARSLLSTWLHRREQPQISSLVPLMADLVLTCCMCLVFSFKGKYLKRKIGIIAGDRKRCPALAQNSHMMKTGRASPFEAQGVSVMLRAVSTEHRLLGKSPLEAPGEGGQGGNDSTPGHGPLGQREATSLSGTWHCAACGCHLRISLRNESTSRARAWAPCGREGRRGARGYLWGTRVAG